MALRDVHFVAWKVNDKLYGEQVEQWVAVTAGAMLTTLGALVAMPIMLAITLKYKTTIDGKEVNPWAAGGLSFFFGAMPWVALILMIVI